MAGRAWTLYGPEKQAYKEIVKTIQKENFTSIYFTGEDRKAVVIANVMAEIQKKNYGFWLKIFMTCIDEIFKNSNCIYPPNWDRASDNFPEQVDELFENKKYTCIHDDRFEEEKYRKYWMEDTESDSAIFLTETGKFVFVSYKTISNYNLQGTFGKANFTTQLEKEYFLKKDNLKANICLAYHIKIENFKKILDSFGVTVIVPPGYEGVFCCKEVINKKDKMVIKVLDENDIN